MQKLTVLILGLLATAGLGLTTAQANVQLILDESTPLGMVGDTNYDLANNVIEISLDRPVICNKAAGYQQSSLTKLRIYDPNQAMKGGFASNGGISFASDAEYVVDNGRLFLDTDNPAKALCVSAEIGSFDLIFKSPFEALSPTTARVEYVGLPSIAAPGQVLNYQIEFSNPSAQNIHFDLLEFWNEHFDLAATMTAVDNVRVCNNSDPNVNCTVNDSDSGVIKAIELAPGGTFVLDVTQKISGSSAIGAELDFMTAVFLTDGSGGDFLPREYNESVYPDDPHVASHTITVANNVLPQISWDVAPSALTSFVEDDSNSQVFEVRYSDAETSSENLTVTLTDQLGNILNTTQGPYVQDGLDGTKTITVLPMANAYTENNPEEITVTVTDAAAGEASLTFDVEVTPVNDAPSFALNCNDLVINEQNSEVNCSGNQLNGVWNFDNLTGNFNPGPNEQQSILDYEVNIVDNSDEILDESGNGSPIIIDTGNGDVSIITASGVYGTAVVEIRVKDDGGVTGQNGCGSTPANPEHGCAVSDWETLTITSQPYKYSVSGEVTGVPSGKLFTLRLDGTENNQPILVDTAITTNTDENTPYPFTLLDSNSQTQFLDDGTTYTVTLEAAPPSHTCVLNNGTGSISGANITNVQVSCTENGN